jgi:competence protein ComFC
MKSFFITLSDFFLPRFCFGCETKLDLRDKVVCNSCLQNISQPTFEILEEEHENKFSADGYISFFTSAFIFEKEGVLQKIIHSLKYENKSSLGIFLGDQLYENRKKILEEWLIDIIIPVPLFHLKKADRGYNQSFYIAKGLSKRLMKKVHTGIMKRIVFTPSQTQLSAKERKQNVTNVFRCKIPKMIEGKNILLIDDVITTGSTINECAAVLKDAGAANVYAASVAIANPLHSFGST